MVVCLHVLEGQKSMKPDLLEIPLIGVQVSHPANLWSYHEILPILWEFLAKGNVRRRPFFYMGGGGGGGGN